MLKILFDCERMKYFNTGLYSYCLNLGQAIQKTWIRRKYANHAFFNLA